MYSPSEAYNHGYLTRDGHQIYWEQCGNPIGSPGLIVHGGPGSGASPWWTQFCDPASCRMVLVDQRGCGRSRPHAGDTVAALKDNTTQHLIGDFEALRDVLGIDSWVLFGGSWGSTLSLAYAVAHPDRVSALVLWAVVLTRRGDIHWLTSTMGEIYPAEYDDLVMAAAGSAAGENLCLAINCLLCSDDPTVADAAACAWCRWEDRIATVSGPVQQSVRSWILGFGSASRAWSPTTSATPLSARRRHH